MNEGTCSATDGCKHGAAIGNVCVGHYDRLGQMLADLELEAAILSAIPSMQIRMDSGGGSLASERSPVRLDVLVHTDRRRGTGKSETDDDAHAAGETLSILDVLHSWARVVREERGLADVGSVTVTGERALLARHLDWCAAQAWVDEMFADVQVLLTQLRAANGHRPDRPFSKCPVVLGAELCHGNVWVRDEMQPVWRRYTDRCAQTWEQAPGAAACDTCGSMWVTEADKARLKRMIADTAAERARPLTEDGRDMETAAEIAERHKVKPHTVSKTWAHRLGVRSVNGYYDPEWFARDTPSVAS